MEMCIIRWLHVYQTKWRKFSALLIELANNREIITFRLIRRVSINYIKHIWQRAAAIIEQLSQ